jgi:hypothetical protein
MNEADHSATVSPVAFSFILLVSFTKPMPPNNPIVGM